MTNKERLQKNNLDLAECLELAKSLPETEDSSLIGFPIEIDTLDNALLTAENDGKVYKCDDKLYQVNKITSLKGLTIKFNEHITPCPVIGEDDEFECSGVSMWGEYFYVGNPPVTAIRKKLKVDSSRTADFAFAVLVGDADSYYTAFEAFYGLDWSGAPHWCFCDENGNAGEFYGAVVITQFDCPALNENPEFIEWILANAKVYPKIECLNDIKGFKLNIQPNVQADIDFLTFQSAIISAVNETNSPDSDIISGQYTASFSINGELVTKTFSSLGQPFEGPQYTFSNSNGDTLVFEGVNYENYRYNDVVIKYNDVVLDNEPIFTTFDCGFNDSYYFLSYALTYGELVDMEYLNGCEWVEYLVPLYQEKTITENGEVLPDEGYDGLSKVVVDVSGEVVEEYDGTITIV